MRPTEKKQLNKSSVKGGEKEEEEEANGKRKKTFPCFYLAESEQFRFERMPMFIFLLTHTSVHGERNNTGLLMVACN